MICISEKILRLLEFFLASKNTYHSLEMYRTHVEVLQALHWNCSAFYERQRSLESIESSQYLLSIGKK